LAGSGPAGRRSHTHGGPVHGLVVHDHDVAVRCRAQRWADMIRVSTSAWAVPLEHLLNAALDALPEVIFAALSTPPVAQHEHSLPGGTADCVTL